MAKQDVRKALMASPQHDAPAAGMVRSDSSSRTDCPFEALLSPHFSV
jgi:hypothetical protein